MAERSQRSQLDVALERLPRFEYQPMVALDELLELAEVSHALDALRYPITSKGHLLAALGGPDATLDLAGAPVMVHDLVRRVPAGYFPIASVENFIEKAADLLRENRKSVDDLDGILEAIERYLDLERVSFPIETPDQLATAVVGKGKFRLADDAVDGVQMIGRIPAYYYPFSDASDFRQKIAYLLQHRPLMVHD